MYSITRRRIFHCPQNLPTSPLPYSLLYQSGYHALGPFAFGFLILSLFLLLLEVKEEGMEESVTVVYELHPSSESRNLLPKGHKRSKEDEFPEGTEANHSQFSMTHNGIQLKAMSSLFPRVGPGACACTSRQSEAPSLST